MLRYWLGACRGTGTSVWGLRRWSAVTDGGAYRRQLGIGLRAQGVVHCGEGHSPCDEHRCLEYLPVGHAHIAKAADICRGRRVRIHRAAACPVRQCRAARVQRGGRPGEDPRRGLGTGLFGKPCPPSERTVRARPSRCRGREQECYVAGREFGLAQLQGPHGVQRFQDIGAPAPQPGGIADVTIAFVVFVLHCLDGTGGRWLTQEHRANMLQPARSSKVSYRRSAPTRVTPGPAVARSGRFVRSPCPGGVVGGASCLPPPVRLGRGRACPLRSGSAG
jgi:hypothetical protein